MGVASVLLTPHAHRVAVAAARAMAALGEVLVVVVWPPGVVADAGSAADVVVVGVSCWTVG